MGRLSRFQQAANIFSDVEKVQLWQCGRNWIASASGIRRKAAPKCGRHADGQGKGWDGDSPKTAVYILQKAQRVETVLENQGHRLVFFPKRATFSDY